MNVNGSSFHKGVVPGLKDGSIKEGCSLVTEKSLSSCITCFI